MKDATMERIYYEEQPHWMRWWLDHWEKDRGHPGATQPWAVISRRTLVHEWNYNRHTHQAHSKIIEKMVKVCLRNYLLLEINTIMMCHTSIEPFDYAQEYLNEDWTQSDFDDWLTGIDEWVCDRDGNWRLSDTALEPIGKLVVEMLETEDANQRLYLIDQLLSVVHRRSDIAALFVEGGSQTCNELFEGEKSHERSKRHYQNWAS